MRLEVRDEGAVKVLVVHATRIDSAVSAELLASVRAVAVDANRLVLELSRVSFLDSSGLGVLVAIRKGLGPGGTLVLAGVQTGVVTLFRLTRLDTIFPMYVTVEDAVEAQARS